MAERKKSRKRISWEIRQSKVYDHRTEQWVFREELKHLTDKELDTLLRQRPKREEEESDD